ncbi:MULTISPECIES: hypothetical protein [unclassified Rhizobium]|uniref:hypothetical protein n=1 Tax=unclassified Rhizobium TaxID=2613769 RepID=UPI001613E036|nr:MULTISPECIES: hypothetical protein [unclassified Rhizobium]MBB3386023.1 hypothetical protein [Rhizobium sp. BK098]MBB3617800.1 hypothetical protein [Rhizobium sp. BK609]MBB3683385.1 hypothetical protein [Rhizobium sp. BK612]
MNEMSDHARLELLVGAYQAAENARIEFEKTFRRLFQPGTPIRWKRDVHVQTGSVKLHAYGPYLFALNERTGKTLKISCYDIIRAGGDRS